MSRAHSGSSLKAFCVLPQNSQPRQLLLKKTTPKQMGEHKKTHAAQIDGLSRKTRKQSAKLAGLQFGRLKRSRRECGTGFRSMLANAVRAPRAAGEDTQATNKPKRAFNGGGASAVTSDAATAASRDSCDARAALLLCASSATCFGSSSSQVEFRRIVAATIKAHCFDSESLLVVDCHGAETLQ
jgi:hypothetical protein